MLELAVLLPQASAARVLELAVLLPRTTAARVLDLAVLLHRASAAHVLELAILAQVASAAWAKVRARVRSAGDGVRAGLGQPATFTRGGAPLRPQIR